MSEETVLGNYYNKYESRNPLAKYMMKGFMNALGEMLKGVDADSILDAGCGAGELSAFVNEKISCENYFASDLGVEQLKSAKARVQNLVPVCAPGDKLPFQDNSFDLLICCEVLEHIPDPERALAELARVGRKYLIASVPWEPIWRGMNILRFAYLSDFGNTPGHVNHWTGNGFRRFIESRFDVVTIRRPFPWTMILGRLRDADACFS